MGESAYRVILIGATPEDEARLRAVLSEFDGATFELTRADGLSTGLQQVDSSSFDTVVFNLHAAGSTGLDALALLRAHAFPASLLALIDARHARLGHGAIRRGAEDFLIREQLEDALTRHVLECALGRSRSRPNRIAAQREQEHLSCVTAMVEVIAGLSAASSTDELCRSAVEQGRSRIGIDRLSIWLLEDGKRLHGTFGTDEAGRTRDEREARLTAWSTDSLGRVALGESSFELQEEPLRSHTSQVCGYGWHAVVPLIGHHERILGVVSADSLLTGREMDEHRAQLLRLYGEALGRMLEGVRADAALHENEAQLTAIFDGAPVAMALLDADLVVQRVNGAAVAFAGQPQASILGARFGDAFRCLYASGEPPRCSFQKPCPECPLRRIVTETFESGKGRRHAEAVHPFLRNGKPRQRSLVLETEPLTVSGREVVLICVQDVTERKEVSQALRLYAERLETLRDLDESILAASSLEAVAEAGLSRLLKLVPYSHADVTIFDFSGRQGRVLAVAGDTPPELAAGSRPSLDLFGIGSTGDAQRICAIPDAADVVDPSGLVRLLADHGVRACLLVPLIAEGDLVGTLNLGASVPNAFTRFHRAAAAEVADVLALAIRQAGLHEQIRLHAEDLERRVADRTRELEEINAELASFSYSVSHDLQVPLRAVRGFSRMIEDQYGDGLAEEGKRLIAVVRDSADRMKEYIDDLLAYSRVSRRQLRKSDVDMDRIVRDACGEIRAAEPDLEIRVQIGDLPPAHGDGSMIRQVWANLLYNAVKFSRERDRVRIDVGSQSGKDETVYYVRDNGVGFDMRYVDKMFGVFQRLHGVDEFEGTGAGLAIAQRIVHRHGGSMWARGKVNEGATFYFALPSVRARDMVALASNASC